MPRVYEGSNEELDEVQVCERVRFKCALESEDLCMSCILQDDRYSG